MKAQRICKIQENLTQGWGNHLPVLHMGSASWASGLGHPELTWVSLCLHTILPPCASVSKTKFRLWRTAVLLYSGPWSWPYFNLIISLMTISPNTDTFWGPGGEAFNTEILGRRNSVCSTPALSLDEVPRNLAVLPVTFDPVLGMLEAGELSLQETRGLGFFFFPALVPESSAWYFYLKSPLPSFLFPSGFFLFSLFISFLNLSYALPVLSLPPLLLLFPFSLLL